MITRPRDLLLVISPLLAVIICLLVIESGGMYLLTAARAYVGGESLWSKAQKEAVANLERYAQTGSEDDYKRYLDFVRVNMGDRQARLELDKPAPDHRVAFRGFVEGRNHPDDIPGMMVLFTWLRHNRYMETAIDTWEEGDRLIADMHRAALALHEEVTTRGVNSAGVHKVLAEMQRINAQLTPLEDRFSYTLGEASRTLTLLALVAGILIAAVLTAIGVALSHRMLRRLTESELQLRLVTNHVPAMIAAFDEGWRLRMWNHACAEFFGFEHPLKEGMSLREIVGDAAFALVEPLFARACLGQTVNYEREVERANGMRSSLEGTLVPRVGSDGRVTQIIAMGQDITQRKRAEEKIRELNATLEQRVAQRTAELQATMRDLEGFSYSVSHDLRAPVRHISGFLGLLRTNIEPSLDTENRRFLDRAQRAARRLAELIDDLLEFSRLGRSELKKRLVDVDALIEDVQQVLAPETQGRSIAWRVGKMPVVVADASLLRVVFMDLLSNAVKYTRGRGEARIEVGCQDTERADRSWCFFVRDNGAGFEMQYADRLFQVFQRLHLQEEFEGTGIGLASVRRIVERHGGKAWATGEPDKGATIYFTLPRDPVS